MDEKGQLMGVPIKLVMALVIGTMTMGVLMQFVGTAERTVLRDMDVAFTKTDGGDLGVQISDAQSGEELGGATIVVTYPGGMIAETLSANDDDHTFYNILPRGTDIAVVTVRVTRNGYIP